jgi:predicted nuclease with TOPRIM domain
LCPDPAIIKEVAKVAGEDRTYTEAEHLALMTDAVRRENAELAEAKTGLESTNSELVAKVDVLEAEKSTLQSEKDKTQTDFDAFKAEVERAREIETAKKERIAAVKAANDQLPETYFTDERVQKWAEMAEEPFAIVIDGVTAAAGTSGGAAKETAAFSGGESPTSSDKPRVSRMFAARRGEKN